MAANSEVVEELSCPICFEIPDDKVFMCRLGHLICDKCCVEVNTCPQCRVSLDLVTVRNRTLEILMDSLTFECSNKDNGCLEKLGRKEIREHSYNCLFKEKDAKLVRFCKLIGYNHCDFIANLLSLPKTLEHFQTVHGFAVRQDRKFSINMKNFQEVALLTVKGKSDTMFKSLIVNVDADCSPQEDDENENTWEKVPSPATTINTEKSTFIILCWIHGKDRNASWTCVSLSPESSLKYHVKFSIASYSTMVPDLSWTTPVIHLDHSTSSLPNPPIRIQLDYLEQHYIRSVDKSVVVIVEILSQPERKCEDEYFQRTASPATQLSMNRVVPLDQQTQKVSSSGSRLSVFSPVIFEGMRCVDCGTTPITDVRYRLPNSENNYCKSCAISGRNDHPWFVVIKSLEIGVDDVDDLWWSKLRSWCVTGYPLGEKRVVKCITPDCRRRAMYTCLQCNEAGHSRLCEDCMEERSRTCDHIFAMCKEL